MVMSESSGERNRIRLNLVRVIAGGRCARGVVGSFDPFCRTGDLKYERNEIIALLAKALLEKAVSRNYVRGANS
jgi:hypothetical protein